MTAGQDFETDVITVLEALAPGDVMTYGEVAGEAGHPGAARAVGSLLRHTNLPLPWWRVVAAGGRLSPSGRAEQASLLTEEGVEISPSGKVSGMSARKERSS
jgi:methylated-DNA-protein-cysteine methyltransferase-like protein